jgi:hypothetical protein
VIEHSASEPVPIRVLTGVYPEDESPGAMPDTAHVWLAPAPDVRVTFPAEKVFVWAGLVALNNPKVAPADTVAAADRAASEAAAPSTRFADRFMPLALGETRRGVAG